MAQHHIVDEIKTFLNLSIVERHHNTIYSTLSLAVILCLAAWAGHSVTDVAQAPSTDTVFYWMESTIERLDAIFRHFVEKVLKQNPGYWRRHTPYLLIDETHESYTGNLLKRKWKTKKEKELCKYIHGYKPKKGNTGSYKFLTFALVGPTKKLIVRSIPVLADDGQKHSDGRRHGEDTTPYIIETLLWIRRYVKFRLAIFDRGFYNQNLIGELNRNNIPYLIRAEICKSMREIMLGMTTKWMPLKYYVGETAYNRGEKTTLVLGRDGSGPWALITNRLPEQAWRLRHYYHKRWNIENIFQVCDGINVHTNSTEIEKKMFCFIVSCLIYNLWQFSREKMKGITLRRFTKKILEKIEEVLDKGPPKDKCRGKERIPMA